MKVLITGTAGFIGSHVAQVLLARGDEMIGVDNLGVIRPAVRAYGSGQGIAPRCGQMSVA